ncbi:hypothetical protein CTI12_AA396370 [Artemisia annua]|uniref:Uncharacterized protein n=1 Tax=Artemisia annua TaxID=35608 RepID=A0A2U1MC48_ARTAN|nr:hypothetical protein CTI12_AA396370 [Artemisia annua]
MRQAEKEWLKEDEAADKALKKLSKDGKKTKDGKTTYSKKEKKWGLVVADGATVSLWQKKRPSNRLLYGNYQPVTKYIT